jgi:CRISPR-associated endonuclease/helicase Cas3
LIADLNHLKKEKGKYIDKLADVVKKEAEKYASKNIGKVRILIEFITKNSASQFFNLVKASSSFDDYKIYLISGDIVEPRRKEILYFIKTNKDRKVLLVSTQVVEAGIDIDMDIGFKNRALLDSDEQMAGRVNRNASKEGCKVFLFDLDSPKTIYGKDDRYKQQQKDVYLEKNWKDILINKSFHELYQRIFADKLKSDWTDGDKLPNYLANIKRLNFTSISNDFQLIEDNQSQSVFIPLEIPANGFDDKVLLKFLDVLSVDGRLIIGEKVFSAYINMVTRKRPDFLSHKIDLKKIARLISLFTINIYPKMTRQLNSRFDAEKENYGFKYLSHFKDIYSYTDGFDLSDIPEDIIL